MTEEKEKDIYLNLDPDLRDWEYDAEGIKRQKKAFHLKWESQETDNKKE